MNRLVLILFFLAGSLAAAPNLISNADLRQYDLSSGQPSGWRNTPALTGLRVPHPDSPGQFALRLASLKAGSNALWVGTLAPIQPEARYRVTARVKAPLNGQFRVYVERVKPQFKAFNGSRWERGTGEWQTVSFDFSFEGAGSQPYLVFCVNTPDDCLATDFQLTQLSE